MKQTKKLALLFFISFLFHVFAIGQCRTDSTGVIWRGNNNMLLFDTLAHYAAPMLWFSPDEKFLYNEKDQKQLPNAFPFEKESNLHHKNHPVVYYKIRNVYASDKSGATSEKDRNTRTSSSINLDKVRALDFDYYYYFEKETGLDAHPHDIESVIFHLEVKKVTGCPYKYTVVVDKVIGRAHGLYWYTNALGVDDQTFFPMSIFNRGGETRFLYR